MALRDESFMVCWKLSATTEAKRDEAMMRMTMNRDVVLRRQRMFREHVERRHKRHEAEGQNCPAGPLQFRPQSAGDEGRRGEGGAAAQRLLWGGAEGQAQTRDAREGGGGPGAEVRRRAAQQGLLVIPSDSRYVTFNVKSSLDLECYVSEISCAMNHPEYTLAVHIHSSVTTLLCIHYKFFSLNDALL